MESRNEIETITIPENKYILFVFEGKGSFWTSSSCVFEACVNFINDKMVHTADLDGNKIEIKRNFQ